MDELNATANMPIDSNRKAMQITPSKLPINTTYNATLANTQYEVTLNASTRFVEVTATNASILMRYKSVAGGTAITVASNGFHEWIQAGTTRHYELSGVRISGLPVTVLAFISQDSAATATLGLIEK